MYYGISNITKCIADTTGNKYSQHFSTQLKTEGHSPTYSLKERKLNEKNTCC